MSPCRFSTLLLAFVFFIFLISKAIANDIQVEIYQDNNFKRHGLQYEHKKLNRKIQKTNIPKKNLKNGSLIIYILLWGSVLLRKANKRTMASQSGLSDVEMCSIFSKGSAFRMNMVNGQCG